MLIKIKPEKDGTISIDGESVGKTCTIFCLAENYYAINDKYQMLYGQKLKAMMVAKIKPQGGGKLHLVYIKEVDKFGYIALSTNYALIDRRRQSRLLVLGSMSRLTQLSTKRILGLNSISSPILILMVSQSLMKLVMSGYLYLCSHSEPCREGLITFLTLAQSWRLCSFPMEDSYEDDPCSVTYG